MSEETKNPKPGARRARLVTTAEGVFVNVNDFKAALQDEEFLTECAAMIKVAQMLKHPPLAGVRMCILNALAEVSGELAAQQKREAVKRIISGK